MHTRKAALLPLVLLAAACAAESGGPVEIHPPPQGHPPQGHLLLGYADEDTVPGLAVSRADAVDGDNRLLDPVLVRQATLHAERPLLRARFLGRDDSGPVTLRIVRICPHAVPPDGWVPAPGWAPPPDCQMPTGWQDRSAEGEREYEVVYRRADTDPWVDLCPDGWNRAIPVAGTWDSRGVHQPVPGAFSFACPTGVVAKCANWGYRPWESAAHFTLHQTCTRMARADYCGTGQSHTIDGTRIDIGDTEGIRVRIGDLNREAAWGPDGAICLTSKRWNSLPLGGGSDCMGLKRDPRTNPTEKYCEEYPDPTAVPGALLYNDSTLVDKGLFRWVNRATGDNFTTGWSVFSGLKGESPPGPGYEFVAFEGAAFRPDLAPEMRRGTVPLYSWNVSPTDRVITVGAVLPGATPVLEGYVYDAQGGQPPRTRPLYTWRNRARGDHLTTSDDRDWGDRSCTPSPCQPDAPHVGGDGYSFVRLEGYLPRSGYHR